jgi:hypothetical protein
LSASRISARGEEDERALDIARRGIESDGGVVGGTVSDFVCANWRTQILRLAYLSLLCFLLKE